MRKVSFGMGVSLDGFIAGRGGDIGWTVPDEELHRFHNEHVRAADVQLCGRRLYEVMRYWDAYRPEWDEAEREFAAAWQRQPKWIASRTLASVGPNATLIRGDLDAPDLLALANGIAVTGTDADQTDRLLDLLRRGTDK